MVRVTCECAEPKWDMNHDSVVNVVVTLLRVYLSAIDVPFTDAAEHGLGVCL